MEEVMTVILQTKVDFFSKVLDNHVVSYIPPETYSQTRTGAKLFKNRKPFGCLVVGAEATNPAKVRKKMEPLLFS